MSDTQPTIQRQPFNPNEHIIQLKSKEGPKDYLPVQFRLVWFRDLCPHGTIRTKQVFLDLEQVVEKEDFVWNNETRKSEKTLKSAKGIAIYHAVVEDGLGGIGEGTGSESAVDFADFIEKAETKSIGRALANLGYGTQFAPEMDEGEVRLADSPIERKPAATTVSVNLMSLAASVVPPQSPAPKPIPSPVPATPTPVPLPTTSAALQANVNVVTPTGTDAQIQDYIRRWGPVPVTQLAQRLFTTQEQPEVPIASLGGGQRKKFLATLQFRIPYIELAEQVDVDFKGFSNRKDGKKHPVDLIDPKNESGDTTLGKDESVYYNWCVKMVLSKKATLTPAFTHSHEAFLKSLGITLTESVAAD